MSGSVWYLSVSKKKIEFKRYPKKPKNKKKNKNKPRKIKNFLFYFILFSFVTLFSGFISAAEINDSFHINVQTTFANGTIQSGTFAFAFNITENSSASCLGPIVYNHSTSVTTDARGIVSIYLPTIGSGGGNLSSLSFDKQYYLCYYRDGTLKDVSQLGRVPYSFRATQINLSEVNINSNLSLGNFNISASSGFFSFLGSLANRITTLFVQNINASGDVNISGIFRGNGSGLTDINIDTLGGHNASFFMPLNTSVYGSFDFNGGWQNNGLSISGGNIFAQQAFFTQINSLNVTNLNTNGSFAPILDNQFDIGNSSNRYRNLWVATNAFVNGTVFASGNNLTIPYLLATNGTFTQLTQLNNGTYALYQFDGNNFNGTGYFNTSGQVNGSTVYSGLRNLTIPYYLTTNNTFAQLTQLNNGTYVIASVLNNGTYIVQSVLNNGTYFLTSNWNATNTSYLLDSGDTATGNYTFDSGTFFIDSTNHFVGINTTTPSATLNVKGGAIFNLTSNNEFRVRNLTTLGLFVVNGTTGNVGIGVPTPAAKLQVNATDNTTIPFQVQGLNTTGGLATWLTVQNATGNVNITSNLTIGNGSLFFEIYNSGSGIIFDTKGNNAVFTDNLTAGVINGTTVYSGNNNLTISYFLTTNNTFAQLTQLNNGTYVISSVLNNGTYITQPVLNNGTYALYQFVGNNFNGTGYFNTSGQVNGSTVYSGDRNLTIPYYLTTNNTFAQLTQLNNGTYVIASVLNNGTYIVQSVLNNGTYVISSILNNGSYFNTLTGTINGAGTLGYIPMWNGTTSLNSSVIYQNGTLVGINTTIPAAKLHINTTDNTTAVLKIQGLNSTGGLADWFFIQNASGRVGIGTATPQNTLNVVGDINATGTIYTNFNQNLTIPYLLTTNNTFAQLTQLNNGTYVIASVLNNGTYIVQSVLNNGTYVVSSVLNNGTYIVQSVLNNGTYFLTSNWNATNTSYLLDSGDTATGNYTFDTNTFHIDSTRDRIGIGLTNPSAKLDVNATDNTTTPFQIQGFNSTGASVTHLFVQNASGNVGVGLTTPQNKLNVLGDINATGTIYTNFNQNLTIPYLLTTNNTFAQLTTLNNGTYIVQSVLNNGTYVIASVLNNGSYFNTGGGGSLTGAGTLGYIPMWNGTTSLNSSVIYQNGTLVGINTTIPAAKLHINTTDNTTAALKIQGLNSTGGLEDWLFVQNASGNVGIGVTNPQNKLDVLGTGNFSGNLIFYGEIMPDGATCAPGEILKRTASNDWDCATDATLGGGAVTGAGTAGYIPMWNGSSSLNNSNVFQNGSNLGINLTTPQNALNVLGDINATTTVFSFNKNLSAGYDLTTNNTFAQLTQLNNGTYVISSVLNNGTYFNTDTFVANYSDFLNVKGLATNNTFYLNSNPLNFINGTYGNATYLLKTGDTATGNYTFDTNTLFIDSTRDRIGIGSTIPTAKLYVNTTDNTTTPLRIQGLNATGVLSDWLYVQNATGNVGIGSTNPTEKLQVNGTFEVGPINSSTGTGEFYSAGWYNTIYGWENGGWHVPTLSFAQANGVPGTENVTVNGNILGWLGWNGWNGSTYVNSASILVSSTDNYNGSLSGARIRFFSTPSGSNAAIESLNLNGVNVVAFQPITVNNQVGTGTSISAITTGTVSGGSVNNYGIYVDSVTGTGAYAIKTNTGDISFGDDVNVTGIINATGTVFAGNNNLTIPYLLTTNNTFAQLTQLNNGTYALYQFGANNFNGTGYFNTSGQVNGSTVYSGLRNLTIPYYLATNGTFMKFSDWNATNTSYLLDSGDTATGSYGFNITSGFFNITNQTANSIFFVNGATGNVGIGTASPSDKLFVNLSTDGGATFNVSAGGNAQISFASGGNNTALIRGAIGGASGMAFFTGANGNLVERVRIDSSGNVGIGTTIPTAKLGINATDNTTNVSLIQGLNTTGGLANWFSIRNATGYVGVGTSTPLGRLDIDARTNPIQTVAGGGQYALLIDALGSSLPSAGSFTAGIHVQTFAEPGVPGNLWAIRVGQPQLSGGVNISDFRGLLIDGAQAGGIGTGNITTAYGVRIGSVNAANGSNYGLVIDDISGGLTAYSIKTGLGDISFGDDVNVTGILNATGTVFAGNNNLTIPYLLTTNNTFAQLTQLNNGTYALYQFGANNFNGTGYFNTSGQVNGSTVYSGLRNLTIPYYLATNNTFLQISNWNATNTSYLLDSGDTATGNYTFDSGTFFIDSTNNRIGTGTTIPAAVLHVNATDNTTTPLQVQGLNASGFAVTHLFVQNASGNVGIGTTTPTSKLHVNGTFNVSGNSKFGGDLYFGGAKIVNSAGTISWRDSTDTNTVLTISDDHLTAGTGYFQLGNNVYLLFSTSAAQIVGGATSTAFRNAANSADNLLITDAGPSAFRNDLNVTGLLRFGSLSPSSINATYIAASAINTTHILDNTILSQDLASDVNTSLDSRFLNNNGDTATGNYTFDVNTFFIDSTNNNVGFGTTTPNASIHIMAGTGVNLQIGNGGAGGTHELRIYGAQTDRYLSLIAGDGVNNITSNTQNLKIETLVGGNISLVPAVGSSVGINTTTPKGALNVLGDINATGTIYTNFNQNLTIPYLLTTNNTFAQLTQLNNGTYVVQSVLNNGTYIIDSVLNNGSYFNTLTGTVTGAGTTGYIPMWNGTTSLNSSVIYQNGTLVGINTTIPAAKLHINTTDNTTAALKIQGLNATGVLSDWLFVQNATGNVGIGTTTPVAPLEISKPANVDTDFIKLTGLGGAVGKSLNISFLASGAGAQITAVGTYLYLNSASGIRIQGGSKLYNFDKDPGVFGVDGTNGILLLNSANVGQKVRLNTAVTLDTADSRFTLDTGGNALINGTLNVSNGTSAQSAVTLSQLSSYLLTSNWNATNSSYITGAEVNNGTYALYQFVGNNFNGTGYFNTSGQVNGSTVYSGLRNLTIPYYLATNNTFLQIANWNATNTSYLLDSGDTATGNYTFDTNTFFIDSTNNRTGFGTTTPTHLISAILNNSEVVRFARPDNAAELIFGFGNFGGGTEARIFSANQLGLAVNRGYEGTGNGLIALFITSGGRIGINTTNPSTLLHLNGSDTANTSVTNLLTLDHVTSVPGNGTAGIGSGILFRTEDSQDEIENISQIQAILTTATNASEVSALAFLTRTGGGALTERLRIDGAGNIGINTTTPQNALNVKGDINSTGTVYTNFNQNLTIPYLLTTNNTFAQLTQLNNGTYVVQSVLNNGTYVIASVLNNGSYFNTASGSVTGAGTTGYIPMWNGTTSLNNSGIYQNGTLVGIGTTVPSSLLHVNATDNTTVPFRIQGLNATGKVSDWVYVQNATGNVGIGTASPNAPLHVIGNFSLGNTAGSNTATIQFDTGDRLSINRPIQFGTATAPQIRATATIVINAEGDAQNIELRTATNGDIFFTTNTTSERARIKSTTGYFGINTTTPQQLLNVVGDINATGTIYTNFNQNLTIPYLLTTNNTFYLNSNPAGFFHNISNFTGNLTNAKFCTYNSTDNKIWCNSTSAETDPFWGANYTNMQPNCSGTDKVVGIFANGTFECSTDQNSGAILTGAGTTGYIPMWNASNQLNNSNIFQNGSNIGVGTTIPSARFFVNTTDNTSNVLQVQGLNATGKVTDFLFIQNATGNLGIGLTNPQNKLNVLGDINATGTIYTNFNQNLTIPYLLTTNNTFAQLTTLNNGTYITQPVLNNGTYALYQFVGNNFNGTGYFNTSGQVNGSTVYSGDKNLTIPYYLATNNTFAQLSQLNNGTYVIASVLNNGTYITQSALNNGTYVIINTLNNGTFAKTNAANSFGGFNQTFNTSLLQLDVTRGRVGINTTDPQNTLNVFGDFNATGTIYTNFNQNLTIPYLLTTNNTFTLLSVLNNGSYFNAASSDSFAGNFTNFSAIYAMGTNNTFLQISNWNATNTSYLLDSGDTATGNYTFDTSTFHIDSTRDRTGIGTTNPSAKLDINVTDNTTTLFQIQGINSTGAGFLNTFLVVQNATGFIGLGNTNPVNMIDINHTSINKGGLSIYSAVNNPDPGPVLFSVVAANSGWDNPVAYINGVGTGDVLQLVKSHSSQAGKVLVVNDLDKNTFTIDYHGGIVSNLSALDNTTTPFQIWASNASGNLSSWLLLQNTTGNLGIGLTNPQNKLNVLGDINATGTIYTNFNQNLTISYLLSTNNTFAQLNAANSFGGFNQTFNTSLLHLDVTRGRVGIGTADPAARLDINSTNTTNPFQIQGINSTGSQVTFLTVQNATGNLNITTVNITTQGSGQIYSNSSCVKIKGATSLIEVC